MIVDEVASDVTPANPTKTSRRARDSAGKTVRRKVLGSLIGASSRQPVGNERYPNLTRYLAIMDILIRVFFIIGLVVLILAVAIAVISGLFLIASSLSGWTEEWEVTEYNWRTDQEETVVETYYHPSTFLEGLVAIGSGIVGGILGYLLLLWCRLVALASLEMIRVFVDNESNTRKAVET